MTKISLFDKEFAHLNSYCGYDAPQFFEWDRSGAANPIAVFTERCYEARKVCSNPIKIAWPLEPHAIHSYAYHALKPIVNDFDYVLTFDEAFAEWVRNNSRAKPVHWTPGGTWIWKKDWGFYPKSKLLSIVASTNKGWTEGHRLRPRIIEAFSDNIDLVAGYGHNPIEYKLDAFKSYMFTICVENSRVNHYWTDKLIDPILCGTVPIYWGMTDVGRYFDPNGMLCFGSLDELGEIIKTLSAEKYESMMPSIVENQCRAQRYAIVEDYMWETFFKDLCNGLGR